LKAIDENQVSAVSGRNQNIQSDLTASRATHGEKMARKILSRKILGKLDFLKK
jgi:hypothetical protein